MPETPFTDTAASAFKLRTTGEDRPVGRIGENTRPVDQSPFFHQHGGPRPERRSKAAKQGDSCGRHGFAFPGERTDGNAFEQFQYRRSRNGYDAVGANDLTVRNGQGADHKPRGREPREQDAGHTNVQDAVQRADLMKTDGLRLHAVHGGFGLQLKAEGDWNVDCHHTVEDTGIVLGRAFKQALGDRSGIVRYGHAMIPMDEALGFCAVDVSGRPYLVFDAAFPQERVGDFDTCMTEEFFRALSDNAGFTLHLRCPYGKNSHHMIEALFKACAHALCDATAENSTGAVLSTKGTLSE